MGELALQRIRWHPELPIDPMASIKLPNFRYSRQNSIQHLVFSDEAGTLASKAHSHSTVLPATIASFSILQFDQSSFCRTDSSSPQLKLPILGAIPIKLQENRVSTMLVELGRLATNIMEGQWSLTSYFFAPSWIHLSPSHVCWGHSHTDAN